MRLWGLQCRGKQSDLNSAEQVTPKTYNFLDLLAVGVGSSLAAGISVLIGELIKNVTGPAVVVSVALAGFTALVAGLALAEFGVRFLKVNSAYAYSYIWGSENSAFIFGWALILQYVACTASIAKAIITFIDALTSYEISEFLKNIFSTDFQNVFPYFDFFSLVIVIAVTILYAVGIKDSIIVKKIFTICNVVLVISVIVIGGFKADVKNWEVDGIAEEKPKNGFLPFGVTSIVRGAAICFYGFIGFDEISVSGSEIKKRKRNLPLAIFATILIVVLAYGGVGAVLTLMLPYYKLNLHAAVPFAFQEFGWTALKWIVAVGTFFGFRTSLFGAMYQLPRIIQAMANDGLLFHCLGYSHSVTTVPLAAAITGGFITAVAAGIFPFQTLVNVAVVGALFVYTVLTISLILFRYSPKFSGDEELSDSRMNLISKDSDVSLKAVMQNYFNFKEKQPTNLTKIIIMGNIALFCLSSVGISVIFTYFYDSLFSCHYGAVIPAGILLCVMFFNLISMTCQPKCRETVAFRMPLIPFVPCLGIFLNVFLMVTFESLTWILFSVWMVVGLIPHFAWRQIKYLKEETGENSLFEINRINAIKLNESIWKIKTDKKSFYEGAVNPVFSDDFDDKFSANCEKEVKKQIETTGMQLMQAEIIQTSEVVTEEKAEPLEKDYEINFLHIKREEIIAEVPEDEQVHWECVAEIHSEEKFPQESVALEIVENNYNFLSQVSDELAKSEDIFTENEYTEDSDTAQNTESDSRVSKPDSSPSSEKLGKNGDSISKPQDLFKGELNGEVEISEINEENQSPKETRNSKETVLGKNFRDNFKYGSELPENSVDILNKVNERETLLNPIAARVKKSGAKEVSDEQNKVKDFKEKLNQLLKNQVNSESISDRNSVTLKPSVSETVITKKKNDLSTVETLNKTLLKGQLEVLLAKGPPKRPSLGSSFNIKIKEKDTGNELKKTTPKVLEDGSDSVINKDEHFSASSSTLENSIKQRILLLKRATNKWTSDDSFS